MKQSKNTGNPRSVATRNNPVSKHAGKCNRSAVFQNKKKAEKQGHTRHSIDYKHLADDGRGDSKGAFPQAFLLSLSLPYMLSMLVIE